MACCNLLATCTSFHRRIEIFCKLALCLTRTVRSLSKKGFGMALNPDAFGKFDYDLAVAKRAIREFSQASSDPGAIADLMIYAVECGNRFTLNCGDIDEDFYDGLIEIYAAAIKIVLQLPKDVRSIYRRRLEKIMESSDGIGWGYHDDLGNLFSRAFPEE